MIEHMWKNVQWLWRGKEEGHRLESLKEKRGQSKAKQTRTFIKWKLPWKQKEHLTPIHITCGRQPVNNTTHYLKYCLFPLLGFLTNSSPSSSSSSSSSWIIFLFRSFFSETTPFLSTIYVRFFIFNFQYHITNRPKTSCFFDN